jgi:hypothetical protein
MELRNSRKTTGGIDDEDHEECTAGLGDGLYAMYGPFPFLIS